MTEENRTRGAAECVDCGRILAVRLAETDVLYPIGSTDGCPCGGTEFRVLGDGDGATNAADRDRSRSRTCQ
ncbi:hypothetical protein CHINAEXTREME_03900 [Halobiforma lacisalsi AJ5]|uniref:Uncharacterized protein n=1 Tax=Natronobacterium lacisalsi AJ5 TaxID=358396 RepID=M0LM85_NATLA|nr:hypothetical protein [Halobiforma lacisalsi]APW96964.1 hypothetical protein CHINAEXTREME_03900 [Halobiforma lacisalsi AJ5]EMA34677.1 hypothetical protein C445_07145 [Halobiforma lacisalsi AJ5]